MYQGAQSVEVFESASSYARHVVLPELPFLQVAVLELPALFGVLDPGLESFSAARRR